MDDMKRAIYLELLRTLERADCRAYICVHLQCQLEDVFGVRKDKSQTNFADLIAEFFPNSLTSMMDTSTISTTAISVIELIPGLL